MITAGDFRNGLTFDMDGQVMQVIEFQHVKPGKGAAFVRTKLKNVISGAVTETTFNPTAKFQEAYVERKDMEYLYEDGGLYYFMDPETYEQLPHNRYQADQHRQGFPAVRHNGRRRRQYSVRPNRPRQIQRRYGHNSPDHGQSAD